MRRMKWRRCRWRGGSLSLSLGFPLEVMQTKQSSRKPFMRCGRTGGGVHEDMAMAKSMVGDWWVVGRGAFARQF